MLSKELAQNICNKMMEVIPYNVNIMNEKGIIIASGDENRIGMIHDGALETLKIKKVVEIYKDNKNVKKGVNCPIFFKKNIIGVIGITGEVDIVREFSRLVSVTAELLVSQEYTMNEHLVKEKLKEDFIYEWIYYVKEYDEDILQKSDSMGININIQRRVLVFQIEENNYSNIENIINKILKKDEYFIKLASRNFLLIIKGEESIDKKIELLCWQLKSYSIKVGVGRIHNIIYYSMMEALEALKIGKKLFAESTIYHYKKVEILDKMQQTFYLKEIRNIIKDLGNQEKNKELLETFVTYIKSNGEINTTARELHVHRNTLKYRLTKIEEITGKKFNDYLDLFQLIASYISYKID